MSTKVILVPTDFSDAANVAYSHAISLANIFNLPITLLHIVKSTDQITSAKGKIERVSEDLKENHNIDCKGIVRTGNIFEDINEVARELEAKFIVMGIHGVKGMEKYLGTPALKVITSSKIPFILVQETTTLKNYYKNIVLPLDLTLETKQKLGYATEIAKKFNSTIHIIVPKTSNSDLTMQVRKNIAFAQNFLNEHNVDYQIKMSAGSSFSNEVVEFASNANADLIAIMNAHETNLNVFGSNPKQNIITNAHSIPVLCVTPRDSAVGFWK